MTDLPKSADEYKPVLPPGFDNIRIDAGDARFKAAQKAAHEAGLSQAQFSRMLGVEAQRVRDASAAAKPAAAAPPRPVEPTDSEYARMSFAQKMALGEAMRRKT